jgi:hypothetical protein
MLKEKMATMNKEVQEMKEKLLEQVAEIIER